MNLKGPEYIDTDVLVIGSGGAGLRAAIAAREKGSSVLLVSKSPIGLGNNTALAGANIAVANKEADPRDSPEVHARDTLESGCFINDRKMVVKMTERAIKEIANLERYGVPLDREKGKHLIRQSPGHSYARTIGGRLNGTGYTLPLKAFAQKTGVDLKERVFISKLLVHQNRIRGALGFDWNGNILVFKAKSVVLAAGGLGHLYQRTNNAAGITGDGYALAFELGVPVRDMEFVQFYPTSIDGRRGIMYELWVVNLGGKIKNALGEDIFLRNGMMTPMDMTRDRTARAVYREIAEGRDKDGGVIFDLSPVSEADLNRFPSLLPPEVKDEGKREFIVSPTCHFHMGGCVVDIETRTNIAGLFAAGEVTGGVHGANRLGSNALTEIFVFGCIAGENAAAYARENSSDRLDSSEVAAEKARLETFEGETNEITADLTGTLQNAMWNNVCIIRNQKGLKEALAKIADIRHQSHQAKAADIPGLMRRLELDNLLLVGEMVTRSALARTESRGSHFRDDYPKENDEWLANLFITNNNGQMVFEKRPVTV